MERVYGEKSYRPGNFEIDFWGSKAGEDSAYLDFQKRKIKGNILLAAYYGPVTADLAPAHIRSSAEYVGALVYRFNSMDNLASVLFDMGWLKSVDDKEKPAVCVVTN